MRGFIKAGYNFTEIEVHFLNVFWLFSAGTQSERLRPTRRAQNFVIPAQEFLCQVKASILSARRGRSKFWTASSAVSQIAASVLICK